jgi:Saxitoxin biosynthesis operon protein SxtJ
MASHEPSPCQNEVKIGSDRSFGFVFAAIFVVIASLPLVRGAPIRWWALALAAAFALAALAAPSLLRPLNLFWFKFGLALHHIVTPIFMGAIFFLAVTPMSLVMRALGKDPLRLKLDQRSATYWIPRERPAPPPRSMSKQF